MIGCREVVSWCSLFSGHQGRSPMLFLAGVLAEPTFCAHSAVSDLGEFEDDDGSGPPEGAVDHVSSPVIHW